MTRDWKIGICGIAFVAIGLLAYAHFGDHQMFFSLLKYTVAISSAFGAWALFVESKRWLPVSLCLLRCFAYEHRFQASFVPYNSA